MDQSSQTVTRGDFERFATELRAELAETLAQALPAGRHDVLSDVLGQLRILKWGAGFALAAIMGAFGVLYQGQADLREEMRGEIAGLRHEVGSGIAGLRQEMRSGIAGLRQEMRSEIAGLRQEMRSEIAGLRGEMQREFRALRQEISSLAERVARLEAGHTYILRRFEEWSSSRSIGPDTLRAPGDAPARAESGS